MAGDPSEIPQPPPTEVPVAGGAPRPEALPGDPLEATARAEGDEAALQDLAGEVDQAAGNNQAAEADREAAENLQAGVEPLREVPPQPDQPPEIATTDGMGDAPQSPETPLAPAPEEPSAPVEPPEVPGEPAPGSTVEEKLDRLESFYEDMRPERLEKELQKLERQKNNWERKSERAADTGTIQWAEGNLSFVEQQIERAQDVLRAKGIEPQTSGTGRSIDDEKQRAIEEEAREFAEIRGMDLDDLTAKIEGLESQEKYLVDRQRDARDTKDKTAAGEALKKIRAQLKESQRVEKQKTKKKEVTNRENEDKQSAQNFEELERERASVGDLGLRIEEDKQSFEDLKGNIREQQEIINDDNADENTKKEARVKLSGLQKKAKEVGDRIKTNEDAKEAAQKRERDVFNLREGMSQDTLRKVSRQEFLEMDEEQRAKYLQELMEVTEDPAAAAVDVIKRKIAEGQPLSILERAQYARDIADQIITNGGRGGIQLESWQALAAQYPEVAKAAFDRVTRSEAAKKMLREKFPNNWDKVLNFAKKNPGWLLILLAMLVAAPMAAAAAVPAAGIGLGVAEGAAGAGLFGFSRSKR